MNFPVPDFYRPCVQGFVRAAVREAAAAMGLDHDERSPRGNRIDNDLRIAGPKQAADRSQEVIHDSAGAPMNAGARHAAHLGLPGRLVMQHQPDTFEVARTQCCEEPQYQTLTLGLGCNAHRHSSESAVNRTGNFSGP